MFILTGTIAAIIISAIQIWAFCEKRSVGKSIHWIIKNIFSINLITIAIFRYVLKYSHFLITDSYKAESFIKFFIVALGVGFILMLVTALFNNLIAFEKETPKKGFWPMFMKILSAIFMALGSACFFGTIWGKEAFGDVAADELFITLFLPTTGTEADVYIRAFEGPVFQTILVTTIFCLLVFGNFKLVYKVNRKHITIFNDLWHRIVSLVLAFACLAGGVVYGVQKFDLKHLFYTYYVKSDIIDSNYVDPQETELKFPEKKRNFIHIYLESMENSYLSKELGGFIDENLMPDLTDLAYEGYVFSNNDTKFGGPISAPGTTWSVASMINMTTGLPMMAPSDPNSYGSKDNFLPGAYTLGDILEKEGYEQTIMFGASAEFGGLNFYYESHGNFKIFDYDYARHEGYIPPDYKVWWGYEDDKLYEFAKEELTRLYETGKPFNFTMETADTHCQGGFIGENTPRPYKDSYANAIAYSSSEAVKFVRWIQEQPFYENTTILLIGDHLSMDTGFFKNYNFTDDYLRTQYNLILNPAPELNATPQENFINRQYANFDMFPTILASLGVEFEGERLGIGTNLFSGEKTVFEENGIEYTNAELQKKSVLYNKEILVDPDKN